MPAPARFQKIPILVEINLVVSFCPGPFPLSNVPRSVHAVPCPVFPSPLTVAERTLALFALNGQSILIPFRHLSVPLKTLDFLPFGFGLFERSNLYRHGLKIKAMIGELFFFPGGIIVEQLLDLFVLNLLSSIRDPEPTRNSLLLILRDFRRKRTAVFWSTICATPV